MSDTTAPVGTLEAFEVVTQCARDSLFDRCGLFLCHTVSGAKYCQYPRFVIVKGVGAVVNRGAALLCPIVAHLERRGQVTRNEDGTSAEEDDGWAQEGRR